MDEDENRNPGTLRLTDLRAQPRTGVNNWRRPRHDARPPQQLNNTGPPRNAQPRTGGDNWRRPRQDERPPPLLDNIGPPRNAQPRTGGDNRRRPRQDERPPPVLDNTGPIRRGRSVGHIPGQNVNQPQRRPYDAAGQMGHPLRHRAVSRDDVRGDFNPNQRNRGRDRYQHMGFLILERVANSNPSDIFLKLNEHREGFMELLNSGVRNLDMIILIFEVLSKVSQSSFDSMKSKLILDVCNSNFIACIREYLNDLPYTHDKKKNKMYWDNQEHFWKNFITFCQDIVDISPATAVRTCRALIESISKSCLEYLTQRHALVLPQEDTLRLEELRNKLANYADKPTIVVDQERGAAIVNDVDMTPPEDFRELSVIPTREDLLDEQPFLRPNIVNGAYSDVEHYLDVQFRLLREDCFGPIRVGVGQYLADPTKRKFDHVRIYRDVKFVGPYISNFKVGTLVQIDVDSNKYFKRINWAHSKRLLFGSLVLFTKNNFSEFIVASILDRDNTLLASGKLPVSIIDSSFGGNLRHSDESYTMIESEVYFEPYLHVLKALQAPSFSKDLPMQEYIVKVNRSTAAPAYLTPDKEFKITKVTETKKSSETDESSEAEDELFDLNLRNSPSIRFTVLNPASWPTADALEFNHSQYEAYKLALTHEFAVIQGPPGTGKTYVGLNVAKALLQNIEPKKTQLPNSRVELADECLMLVICYTNHALDQFLEEISRVTNKIARIGGQSRNKAMDRFNLSTLRKSEGLRTSRINSYFIDTKTNLRQSIGEFQESLLLLDILNYGVVNLDLINDVPQVELLCKFYENSPYSEDPLMHWLFTNHTQYYTDLQTSLTEYENLIIDDNENEFNIMRTDYNIVLDDDNHKKNHLDGCKKRMASFLLTDTKLALKKLVKEYLNNKHSFKDRLSIEMAITDLSSKINLYYDMTKLRSRTINLNITNDTDFTKIVPRVRWQLYFTWIRNIQHETKKKVMDFENVVSPLVSTYEETRMVMDMELLKNKQIKVLGLTTSGAARMRKLLNALSPKIVIVEEAAEVLEQHIITSLTMNCQHLILIGDHQQLRPSASYLKLAKQYNIEVSLFERMITNGIHSRRLNVQHRMRPEIAALISPHIYPELENHPTVEDLGNVRGLEKNVFFFTHEHREEENPNEGNSRSNHKEADLTLALANYLLQQGYESHEVTILAAYSGQMFYMRKERQKYACLKNVKITVVDNYQGEESRIILLSLVRNNPDNVIGFLGTENRICVALSRAKKGFYMFGNINMLKTKSDLWKKIAATLENKGSVGPVLNLKCQVHPDQITPVKTADDFNQVPEGGCLRKCNYMYSCGHHCLLYCHGYDRDHVETKCREPCERILCNLDHVCPLVCSKDCDKCKVLIRKTLPCGHEMDVFCHLEPEDPEIKCRTKIEIILEKCGHKVQKECHLEIEKVKCTTKCKQRLEDCGHACERTCHVAYPDHKDYVCLKDCTKRNKGCMAEGLDDLGPHQCKKKCFEPCNDCHVQVMKKRSNCKHAVRVACCVNVDDTPCNKKCARSMDCGHFCKKQCSEPCGNCKTMVTKVIPDCKHKIKIACETEVSRKNCTDKCERSLPCGHPCTAACREVCDERNCIKLVSTEVDSPCGHKVKLPCNIYNAFKKGDILSQKLIEYCRSPCGVDLACGHLCGGSCSLCHQGRIHAPCKQKCNQIIICGHQCQEPCNQICPPCSMLCEVQCQHSRCSKMCGEPCVECKEKCNRSCPHGACSRLCSQECTRAPCAEACPRALPCGHRCRGVCGEPCPDVCRICRPDDFPTDFLGDEYEEDDKFILLEDCGHVLELENMDNLMMGDQENIKIRQCPYCRKPIINTNRYKDLVNNLFKNDINPIKERVYGKNAEINTKLLQLKQKVQTLYSECRGTHEGLRKNLELVGMFLRSNKKTYLLQVEMLLIHCNLIELVLESWRTFRKIKTRFLDKQMEEFITIILKSLKIDLRSKVPIKISEQQQKDIGNEIKRLHAIVQLDQLLETAVSVKHDPKVKPYIEAAINKVCTLFVFDEDKAILAVKALQTAVKTNIAVSKMDRDLVVKVIGLKAGHWYKCPNGHYYCIDSCGGAMEVSKCPDCKEAIGGTSHKLLSGNAHAPEMDGSKYAAYSEEANNMANFQLEF